MIIFRDHLFNVVCNIRTPKADGKISIGTGSFIIKDNKVYGRELLITLAQTVFDKEKHPSPDGTDIGKADSKRMLEAYIHYCLHKRSKEREIKFAKSSIDFSNELTHNRTATQMDAELCYNAVLSTVHIIKVLNKFND